MTDQASIRKSTAAMLALLLLLAAQGCTSFNPVPPPKPGAYAAYRVGAPDVLAVTILPEPVIQREVTVRPDGMISLELIGDVPAATAILDRFLHHAEIITITGRSYRLKDRAASTPDTAKAEKRQKKTKTGCQEQQK